MSASASARAGALPSLASRPTFQPSPAPTSPPPQARTPSFSRADGDRSYRSNRSEPSHLTHPTHPPNSSSEPPSTYPPLPSPPLGTGASRLHPPRDDGVALSDFLSSPPNDRDGAGPSTDSDFGPSMSQGRSPFDTGSGASSNRGYAGSGSGWGSSISAGGSNPRTRAGAGHFEATSNVDATNGHISGVQAPARDQDQDRDKEQGEGHGPGAVSVAGPTDWEAAFEARRREEWKQKVQEDLKGWRGGNG
jgi:hypothetical protein